MLLIIKKYLNIMNENTKNTINKKRFLLKSKNKFIYPNLLNYSYQYYYYYLCYSQMKLN